MTSAANLSISDPDCVMHMFQQVLAFGKQQGSRFPCVAALQASVCPSKAKVEVVFKQRGELPPEVVQDIKNRFSADIEGLSTRKFVFHQIPLPLHTRTGLSNSDVEQSLSRSKEHEYHFPLVTHLEYNFINFTPEANRSEKERSFVHFIQSNCMNYFPNIDKDSSTISDTAKSGNPRQIYAQVVLPQESQNFATNVCNVKFLMLAALVGVLFIVAYTRVDEHSEVS